MAVYDYATTFTQLLQQKYAKELCSDALAKKRLADTYGNARKMLEIEV